MKNYSFKTNVRIDIDESSVGVKDENGSTFISIDKLDNFTYSNVNLPRMTAGALWFRTIGTSLLIAFITGVISDKIQVAYLNWFILVGILFVFNVLFAILVLVEALFDIKTLSRIIDYFFSNALILVKIGNKSGNNIEFYTLIEEKTLVLELKKKILSIIENSVKSKISKTENITRESNLDELLKLSELLKNGTINENEFIELKNKILTY
jgi:hypothetical protein